MKYIVFVVWSLVVFSNLAFATPQDIQKLIESPTRPTISQFLDAFDGKLPEENPFPFVNPKDRNNNGRNFQVNTETWFRDLVREDGARTIARLEQLFPGGIWYPLGRDAAWVGDVLDAFYVGQGQKGRVVRLDVSTQSYQGPDNEAMIEPFLRSAGLIVDTMQLKISPPKVVLDRSDYGGWRPSQTLITMQVAYKAYAAMGGGLQDL